MESSETAVLQPEQAGKDPEDLGYDRDQDDAQAMSSERSRSSLLPARYL